LRGIAVLPRFNRGYEAGEFVVERTGLKPSLIAFGKSHEHVRPSNRFSRQRDWPRDACQFQGRELGFTGPPIPGSGPIHQPDRILRTGIVPRKEKRGRTLDDETCHILRIASSAAFRWLILSSAPRTNSPAIAPPDVASAEGKSLSGVTCYSGAVELLFEK